MLKIYGAYRSRATRTLWMVGELGIPYEHIPVLQARRVSDPLAADAPINTRSPAFLAVNPLGTIPAIEDDGLVLRESLAINLYLAKKHGGDLAPKDLAEDALMMQWSLFAATEIEANALRISYLAAEGKLTEEGGQSEAAAAARLLAKPFGLLESHLAGTDYLVSNRFTAADINVAEVVRYASPYEPLMQEHPKTAAWLARCQARPAFKQMWEARAAEPA